MFNILYLDNYACTCIIINVSLPQERKKPRDCGFLFLSDPKYFSATNSDS